MASKTLATIVIIFAAIIFFPIAIGIFGGIFGIIAGIFGAVFGVIAGVFGAVFGILGGIFGAIFHTSFIAIAIIIICLIAVNNSRKNN